MKLNGNILRLLIKTNLNRDQVFFFQILLCRYQDKWCRVGHVFTSSYTTKIYIKHVYLLITYL